MDSSGQEFVVTVVTLCDIFIQDIQDLLALVKVVFSLINKTYENFFTAFCIRTIANSK